MIRHNQNPSAQRLPLPKRLLAQRSYPWQASCLLLIPVCIRWQSSNPEYEQQAGMPLKELLDQLFRSHQQELLRFAGQRAGDAAEDLVQLSFLRLLQHPEIDTIVNHRAYLYKLTANAVIDHHRKAAIRAQYHADPDEIDEVPSLVSCPATVLHHQQMLERCLRALDALPPLPRTIFLLHRFDGLTYSRIAKLLGLSRSSVERHFYTALEHCFAASLALDK